MPVYQYDGKHYDLPDGLTNEQALAKIKAHLGEAPATVPSTVAQESPSMIAQMFGLGSPIARTLKGAIVDPALAVNQLLANTGLFGQTVKQGANRTVQQYEQATQEARQAMGSTGFDPYQLLGAVVSPVNKIAGPLASAGGTVPGIARAAGTGALLAAAAPVTSTTEDYATAKLAQMGTGAVFGVASEAAVKGLQSLSSAVKGLTKSGRQEALQKHLNDLAGEDRAAMIEALRDAKELVKGSRPTVAEVLADVPTSVELAAAQKKLASMPGGLAGKFETRAVEQQAARARALQAISGTEAERAALAVERNAVTGPIREEALARANVAMEAAQTIEQRVMTQAKKAIQATEELSGLPYPTGNLDVQQATKAIQKQAADTATSLKQFQMQSLQDSGVFPLMSKDVVSQIDKAIAGAQSDTTKTVLSAVKDKILSKTDKDGFISSRDLYENVRKMSNQDIASLLNLGDKFASGGIPQQAAAALGNVKKFIDSSLNKSSGGLWSKYIKSYTDYSTKLNRMEIGEYLSSRLNTPLDKERAGVFATAVENAAGTIKKATGIPRYEKLSDVLTPQQVASVNGVLADLNRATKAASNANKVSNVPTGPENVLAEAPNLLSRTVTVAKAAIEHLQRGNAKAFNEKMAELMLNPQEMAKFMTTQVPKGRIKEFTSSLMSMMDEPTKAAFIQSFTVPTVAKEIGAE